MTDRSGPPDWALPARDADPGDTDASTAAPRRAAAPAGTFGLRVRSVSEVSRAIRDRVRGDDLLRDVWVEGEVGRVTVSSAGHAYFTLKDARSQLPCVWFRDDRARSPFQPRTGLQVVAHGRMDYFEPQGALQLYVESIQPAGLGDLAVRFEQLKARLAAEGLFDAARKRPLPPRPVTIAVVTSPSGVVWRDVCTVLARRWPLVQVVLVACQVQGESAPASIVAALRHVERWVSRSAAGEPGPPAPDVTILARGGGSLEDLWAFNDERVVHAVVAHPVPVVCGVGHETDVTLADFAADVRAATPSAAAELVVPDRVEAAGFLAALGRRATAGVARILSADGRVLDGERRALARLEPRAQLAASRETVGLLLDRASRAVADRLASGRRRLEDFGARAPRVVAGQVVRERGRLAATAAGLVALGPQATLDRGYAIVRRGDDGAVLRDPTDAAIGTRLLVRLARGTLAASSEGAAPDAAPDPPPNPAPGALPDAPPVAPTDATRTEPAP